MEIKLHEEKGAKKLRSLAHLSSGHPSQNFRLKTAQNFAKPGPCFPEKSSSSSTSLLLVSLSSTSVLNLSTLIQTLPFDLASLGLSHAPVSLDRDKQIIAQLIQTTRDRLRLDDRYNKLYHMHGQRIYKYSQLVDCSDKSRVFMLTKDLYEGLEKIKRNKDAKCEHIYKKLFNAIAKFEIQSIPSVADSSRKTNETSRESLRLKRGLQKSSISSQNPPKKVSCLEQIIKRQYGTIKSEVLKVATDDPSALSSQQLKQIIKKVNKKDIEISDIQDHIEFVKRQTALKEKLASPDRELADQLEETLGVGSKETSDADENNKLKGWLLANNKNPEAETIQEIYEEADPVIPLTKTKYLDVLSILEDHYEEELKISAPSKNETIIKSRKAAELASIKNLAYRMASDPNKLLQKEVRTELETILKNNSYKLQDVEVMTEFATAEEDSNQLGIPQAPTESMPCLPQNDSTEEEHPLNLEDLQIDLGIEKTKEKNHIESNKIAVMGPKSVMKIIEDSNPPLISQNIPFLSSQTKFSRIELHTLYTMYKALCQVTSQRYKVMEYDASDGIDSEIFRKGVYQVFIQSDLLAKRIFETIDYNYSNFMNWPEFISGMQMIKAKTLSDKIGLFIRLADEDGNRLLSEDEIKTLCEACLSRFIKAEGDFSCSISQSPPVTHLEANGASRTSKPLAQEQGSIPVTALGTPEGSKNHTRGPSQVDSIASAGQNYQPIQRKDFLSSLVDYFTKIIFQSLGYEKDQEIPLETLKEYILNGGQNAHLFAMFCGADF